MLSIQGGKKKPWSDKAVVTGQCVSVCFCRCQAVKRDFLEGGLKYASLILSLLLSLPPSSHQTSLLPPLLPPKLRFPAAAAADTQPGVTVGLLAATASNCQRRHREEWRQPSLCMVFQLSSAEGKGFASYPIEQVAGGTLTFMPMQKLSLISQSLQRTACLCLQPINIFNIYYIFHFAANIFSWFSGKEHVV